MPRLSTFKRAFLIGAGLLVLGTAGSRRKPAEDPPPPVIEVPTPPPEPVRPPDYLGMFASGMPLSSGPTPVGLANSSAQGCNGCHYEAAQGWSESAHAKPSPAYIEAATAAADPTCRSCHQPLAAQHGTDATLAGEHVTCAACHLRDGQVISSKHANSAPHPTRFSPELAQASFCANCHQLNWAGADRPLYDTFGEWERSPQAAAGIGCVDCHMRSAADGRAGADHSFPAPPARAISLLVDLPQQTLVRGQGALSTTIVVQNTGAGHSFPTGSPWKSVRLQARLVGPPTKTGPTIGKSPLVVDFRRSIEKQAPWRTLDDTRIVAGSEASFQWEAALPIDAAPGPWAIEVGLFEVSGDKMADTPITAQRFLLNVQ